MKTLTLLLITSSLLLASCGERIEANYVGVLIENFGKNGKQDCSVVTGKVFTTFSPGTKLYQVPTFLQRANFGEDVLHLKAADNTEFFAKPSYSYYIMKDRVVDVVFNNARLGSGNEFMSALQDNVLENYIYDILKDQSRAYITDTLMANRGSLVFENRVKALVAAKFAEHGLALETFSTNLDFSNRVKEKIDSRNEVNTNVSVLDQKIIEQRKRNELAALEAEEKKIRSSGLTNEILAEKWIEKWNGTMYGTIPHFLKNVE